MDCPEVDGFTGCLYQKNGSSETFCFKSGPQEQCHSYNQEYCEIDGDPKPAPLTTSGPDIDNDSKPDILNNKVVVRPCLEQNFPNLASMSQDDTLKLCCNESDCQNHAGCFADELDTTFTTFCQCFLGYYLESSTEFLPITGECLPMNSQDCSSTSSASCYDTDQYSICPYCHVTDKTGSDHSIIAQYESGDGTFDSDPMIFRGSSPSCSNDYSMNMYWYCWYDVIDADVVDPSDWYLVVEEHEECQHWAYIYTPLACDFAQEA